MGYGSLVNNYSNVADYPNYRRKGITFNYRYSKFSLQFVHSDLKELEQPSMIALQGTFEYIENLNLTFNIVTDINQKRGLLDSDGDGYPDFIEPGYANNPNMWHDNQTVQDWLDENCIDPDSDENFCNNLDETIILISLSEFRSAAHEM